MLDVLCCKLCCVCCCHARTLSRGLLTWPGRTNSTDMCRTAQQNQAYRETKKYFELKIFFVREWEHLNIVSTLSTNK